MIITLTANPSLDRTVDLSAPLRLGEVQAARSVREDAGGKGVNVSRVAAAAGHPTLAILPLDPTDPYALALRAAGVPIRPVPIAGAARANIALTDPGGRTTKINLAGATLGAADGDALVAALVEAGAGADWLVLAGSLPPGLPEDFYVTVIRAVRAGLGAAAPRIAVDTSGPALDAVVAEGMPDLIKPNDEELAALVGEPGSRLDADALLAAARELVPHRVGAALVTLGAGGAMLVSEAGAWHAAPPAVAVRSTVGAGDSSLAGYVLAQASGADAPASLAEAVRYGAAAASLPGTQPPRPQDLPAGDVTVQRR